MEDLLNKVSEYQKQRKHFLYYRDKGMSVTEFCAWQDAHCNNKYSSTTKILMHTFCEYGIVKELCKYLFLKEVEFEDVRSIDRAISFSQRVKDGFLNDRIKELLLTKEDKDIFELTF